MRKKLISILLTAVMLLTLIPAFTLTASAADDKTVSDMNSFIEAMKASGTATIKLGKNISCKHGLGSEGHTAIVVNGNKTLDLNGKSIICNDESNAKSHGTTLVNKSHWFTDCKSTDGNDKVMIKISSGASLTVNDSSSAATGQINFKGKIVGSMFGTYYDRAHFNGYTTRDIFDVNGTLTINKGNFYAGNTSEHWVGNGVNLDKYDSFKVHFNDNAIEQIFGTVAVVNNGGKLVVNGGNLYGKGIEADLKAGVEHMGDVMKVDTWIEVAKDEVTNLISGKGDSENVTITRRDEVIEVKGGKVEINGGYFMAENGANIFGGNPSGKVKITAGRFDIGTAGYLRVKDDEYHSGKFYGTVIQGRKGFIGIKSEYLDLNSVFVATGGVTYDTPEKIKAKDFESAQSVVVVGEKEDPTVEVTLTTVLPERHDIEEKAGYYSAYTNEKIDFAIDALPLTAEQKANGYTLKKTYRIMNEDPNAESTNITNSTKADGVFKFSHTFKKPGWYSVMVSASVQNKNGEGIGSTSYTYNFYAFAKTESLEVTKMPAKTTYKVGEKIDPAGMAITAHKSNGEKQDVTKWSKVLQEDAVTNGQTYFVVEYTQTISETISETYTVTVPITVESDKKKIETAKFTVTEPKSGETPKNSATSLTDGVKVTSVEWTRSDGKAMDAKFSGSTNYNVKIYFDAADGYEFASNFGNDVSKVSINGVYALVKDANNADGGKNKYYAMATLRASGEPLKEEENKDPENYVFPFTDVPSAQWYFDSVMSANKMGLINGKSATLYKPNDNMTVAEAVKLAVCMNILYNGGDPNTDIANGTDKWYSTYMTYALDKGIIDGDLTARANEKISRKEYTYIFSKSLPKEAFAEKNIIPAGSIPDVKEEKTAQDKAIYLFYRAGILSGSDKAGTFNPANNIKRSEVAAILIRMMDESVRVGAPADLKI